MKSRIDIGLVLAFLCCTAGYLSAREATWTGAGPDAKWEDSQNWFNSLTPLNGDSILLPACTNPICRNGTSNLIVAGITFDATAAAYQLSGKPIKLKGNIVNNSKNLQTINFYITLVGNRTITAGEGGDIAIGGIIRGEHFGIDKGGPGQLTLTGANTYTGQTTIHAGTILLVAANAISPSSNVVLDGGKLGFDVSISPNLGALKVASPSVIDFGSSAHTVAFANSSALPWKGTLSIYNWSGKDAANSLTFGADNTSLTPAQLKTISFYSDAGTTLLGTGAWAGSNGQLTFFAPPAPVAK